MPFSTSGVRIPIFSRQSSQQVASIDSFYPHSLRRRNLTQRVHTLIDSGGICGICVDLHQRLERVFDLWLLLVNPIA
jgi:hypothetical protein